MKKRIPTLDEFINESINQDSNFIEVPSDKLVKAIETNKLKGYKCNKINQKNGLKNYEIYKGSEKIAAMMQNQFDEWRIYANTQFVKKDLEAVLESELLENKDIRLLTKGDKIEFVVPGTSNELGEETVINRVSSRSEDFAVVKYKGKEINVPFSHISYIVEREFSSEERQKLTDKGFAMEDGSYPIETVKDLQNAIRAFGRTGANKAETKKHIIKRAKALGKPDELPEDWK
ncbi:MAG: hypothetical protein WC979_01630 [Candidatus Pacearchaeota archaeon]|jgi:hypothetical protein|nr:hypothetical protein [Clostridia bacterium]